MNKTITYQDDNLNYTGYYAWNEKQSGKRPAILIVHDWTGLNDFAKQKAEKLAELGYLGFALDMFGGGKLGKTNEEKSALISPLVQNRALLLKRVLAGLNTMKHLEHVDTQKMGAIGFCFGGLCVLDLARSGEDIKGVVSFHGLLGAPPHATSKNIRAKVLALHGHDDPMVPPDQVLAFQKEMTHDKADWQMHIYGHTSHAFMNPAAHDTQLGTIYNPVAENRAWIEMKNFFSEVFI